MLTWHVIKEFNNLSSFPLQFPTWYDQTFKTIKMRLPFQYIHINFRDLLHNFKYLPAYKRLLRRVFVCVCTCMCEKTKNFHKSIHFHYTLQVFTGETEILLLSTTYHEVHINFLVKCQKVWEKLCGLHNSFFGSMCNYVF